MLTVGDSEHIVGNDELDVGDSEVASFGGWNNTNATGRLTKPLDKGSDELALVFQRHRHKNI